MDFRALMVRNIRNTLLGLLGVFLCLEFGLRLLPYFVPEPLKSFIEEAERIPKSNTRVYSGFQGGTRIFLPNLAKADLLVLGDSIAFGTYVSKEDTFPEILANSLSLSVANLAIGSQSMVEYNRMFEIGKRYRPEQVLYCVFANDFGILNETPIPDEELFLEKLDLVEKSANLIKRVSNLSLLYQISKFLKQPSMKLSSVFWTDRKRSFQFAPKEFWDPKVGWQDARVKKSVELNLKRVQQVFAQATVEGMSFLVVLLPSKEMVFGPLAEPVGAQIYHPLHKITYSEFEKGLKDSHIPTLNLLEPLRTEAQAGKKLFLTLDGHYNEEGHQAIALLLTNNLRLRH